MEIAIIYGLAVFVGLWGFYFLLGYRAEKKELKRNIGTYYHSQKRKSMIVLLGDRFDQTKYAEPMRIKLIQANIPLTPSEFIGVLIVSWMGLVIAMNNFFKIGFPINLFIAIGVVEVIRRSLFFIRRNKQKERLTEQLPEVCRMLANATRSGMTIQQAFSMVARETADPAKTEFERLAYELHLGVDFTRALRNLEKRISNREYKLFVATLLIQKKSGGNLFMVLDEMAQTLDERKVLLQEIKTMTAEQRYVSYLVPVIPIILVLMMNNITEGFIEPLFTGVGLILLALFLAGTALTFILVKKVTNIRV